MIDGAVRILASPDRLLEECINLGSDLTGARLTEFQLTAARDRFLSLRPRIAALDRLAAASGIKDITSVGDLARVLFPHTVYKSYPLSAIEQRDFRRLTHWLGNLTVADLSHLDMSGVGTIDEWIERLDARTDIRVVHSFGTTGKLSFVPRSREEWFRGAALIGNFINNWKRGTRIDFGAQRIPFVQPSYRYGASAAVRGVATLLELYGDEERSLFLLPAERFSADIAALAGRLTRMRAHGDPGGLELAATVLATRERAADALRRRPQQLNEFFDRAGRVLAGRDVYLFGFWPTLHEWAEEGLKRGVRGVFGPRSILHTGGGTKGIALPDGWKERVFEFLGFSTHHEFYTMTELIPACPRCEVGNYHFPSVLVPILLDSGDGRPLERDGLRTGRLALFDLLATSYWGGFVTGDEVTVGGWDEACACGRNGPFALADIRRFSEANGGDDKINCAGTAKSYANAIEYLAKAEVAE